MSSEVIIQELSNELSKLRVEQQHEVLEFARSLVHAPPVGVHGRNLLGFAGAIDKSDLEVMRRAIEEDCEKVSMDEW
jgi:hypothetical protein